jgi:hypothetical protein
VERENELQQELKLLLAEQKGCQMKVPEVKASEKLAFEKEQEAVVFKQDTMEATIEHHLDKTIDEGPAIDYERPPMDLFKAIFEDDIEESREAIPMDMKNHDDDALNSLEDLSALNTPSIPRRRFGPTFPQRLGLQGPTEAFSPIHLETVNLMTSIQKCSSPSIEECTNDVDLNQPEHSKKERRSKHKSHRKDKEERRKRHRKHEHPKHVSKGRSVLALDSESSDDVVIWTEKSTV